VEDGVLSFVDIADDNGTQFMDNAYGTEFVDFDDDGDLDLYMTGADAKPTKIWRNNGDKTWTDVDTLLGRELLSDRGMDLNGSRAIDYDNDGDLDLFFHDNIAGKKARMLYRNDGDWNFTNVTDAEGFTAANEGAYDSVWGDLDLDGDLDLACATNSTYPERIFLSNASTNGNSWLQIRLRGPAWNTTAIGASVYVTIHAGTPQERTLRREANTNAGAFNQSDVPVHFGLGTATVADSIRVQWPDKSWSSLRAMPLNQTVEVIDGTDAWTLQ
jgi:enediyne biosynthesis protein E4